VLAGNLDKDADVAAHVEQPGARGLGDEGLQRAKVALEGEHAAAALVDVEVVDDLYVALADGVGAFAR